MTAETRIKVAGMSCCGCAERLQRVLTAGPGIGEAEVSHAEGQATVRFNERVVSEQSIHELIRRAGFDVVTP